MAADVLIVAAVLRLFGSRLVKARDELKRAFALTAVCLVYPCAIAIGPWVSGHAVGQLLPVDLDAGAPAMVVVAALLLAGSAAVELRAGLQARTQHGDELELELASVRAVIALDQQIERSRMHDARSAVAGVLGASAVLNTDALAESDRRELRRLIALEVARLAAVLGLEPAEQLRAFDLREALTPVLRMHRLRGVKITWDVPAVLAWGCAQATATALDNLVHNVAVHASGAPVHVSAAARVDVVEIAVDDGGPGIPPDEWSAVLEAGARGSSAQGSGSGLGLANVAATMASQGGCLSVGASPLGGARATMTLPASLLTAAAC